MLREAGQVADVAADQLGGAVVVVEDGDEAVVEGVVGLAEEDVD